MGALLIVKFILLETHLLLVQNDLVDILQDGWNQHTVPILSVDLLCSYNLPSTAEASSVSPNIYVFLGGGGWGGGLVSPICFIERGM